MQITLDNVMVMDIPEGTILAKSGSGSGAYMDSFGFVTGAGGANVFLDALRAFGQDRRSFVTKVKDVEFVAVPECNETMLRIICADELEKFEENAVSLLDGCDYVKDNFFSIEAAIDSMRNGTPVMVRVFDTSTDRVVLYPLRDTAIATILARLDISGSALGTLPRNILADHLNAYAKFCKRDARVIINNGKLECMLGPNYPLVPAEDVMAATIAHFEGKATFDGGSFTHTRADSVWNAGNVELKLPTSEGLVTRTFSQSVRVFTSDSGRAAMTIMPTLREEGERHGLSFCLPLQVEHKGKGATIEKFREQLTLIEKRFSDSWEKIVELSDLELQYPANVLLALLKWLRIPAKYGVEVYERRKAMWGDSERSAYEVYGCLSDVLSGVYAEEQKMTRLAEYQEICARGYYFDFGRYDLPGEYSYTDRLIGSKGA